MSWARAKVFTEIDLDEAQLFDQCLQVGALAGAGRGLAQLVTVQEQPPGCRIVELRACHLAQPQGVAEVDLRAQFHLAGGGVSGCSTRSRMISAARRPISSRQESIVASFFGRPFSSSTSLKPAMPI